MKSTALAILATAAVVAFGFYGWNRAVFTRGRADVAAATVDPEEQRHKVTPRMLSTALTHERTKAPTFLATAGDGREYDSQAMLAEGPYVLIFIKAICPCSVEAEAYFNAIHAAYAGRARFYGVIDGDAQLARLWAETHGVPFPILADPDSMIVRAFGVENSAYVAVVDRDGTIAQFWPGFSMSMLRDLSLEVARLNHLKPETLETPDAPDELYSGCPF